jgi:predicted small secreted protein
MKKLELTFLVSGLIIGSILLAACSNAGASSGQNVQGAAKSATQGVLKADYQNALPVPIQLALGIFKLEESSYPLSKDEAAALLPLWKAYHSLTNSETSSAEEISALIEQVQQTLSAEQLQSIADLQLTGQDLAQLAQDKNIAFGGGRNFNFTPEQQATRQAQRGSGQFSGGGGGFRQGEGGGGGFGPGGGGFGSPPGLEQTPGALQTAVAQRGGANGAVRVNSALVGALITYLEGLAQ